MVNPVSSQARLWARLPPGSGVTLLMLLVSALGLALRLEHAITFDGPGRGSDYATHVVGVRWMWEHRRPFRFSPDLEGHVWSLGYQAPLWYAIGALILKWTQSERAIAAVAVAGWAVRQWVLARLLHQAIPARRWSILAALTINAFLPVSVLSDGKVNPEGLHTTLFTVALYFLWRMERQLSRPAGVSLGTAATFGLLSGVALLTKATASILPMLAVIVLSWRAWRLVGELGWRATWQRLGRPALLSAGMWCLLAGWWCGPNLVKFGHPFPHTWDRDTAATQPVLAQPPLYRRPLGWALPFTWREYLDTPVILSDNVPRPNLWGLLVTGTWSDVYNRGFCRLQGGGSRSDFWGGWPVSGRCLRLLSLLSRIGCFISLLSVFALVSTLARYFRSDGRDGSLVLPLAMILVFVFVSLFALVYPYDYFAVLNPRYLLPGSTALSACLGLTMARWEDGSWKALLLARLLGVAIGVVAVLVVLERWGR